MPLLFLLGAGLWLYLSQAKKFLETMSFTFSDIRLDAKPTLASGLTKVFLKIKVAIKNSSSFQGKLLNMHLDIYYQGKLISTINQNESVQFNPLSTTTALIPVTLSTVNAAGTLVTIIKNLIEDSTNTPELTFKGYADVTAGRMVVNEKRKLSL